MLRSLYHWCARSFGAEIAKLRPLQCCLGLQGLIINVIALHKLQQESHHGLYMDTWVSQVIERLDVIDMVCFDWTQYPVTQGMCNRLIVVYYINYMTDDFSFSLFTKKNFNGLSIL